jgi:hypothetical protein
VIINQLFENLHLCITNSYYPIFLILIVITCVIAKIFLKKTYSDIIYKKIKLANAGSTQHVSVKISNSSQCEVCQK